jgi:hypothetical protein
LIFEGIDYTQLSFARVGTNGRNLEISVAGTDDTVTVTDWFVAASRQIEHIEADGYVLDGAEMVALIDAHVLDGTEVVALIDALAGYTPPPEGDDSLVPPLEDILNTYWDVV